VLSVRRIEYSDGVAVSDSNNSPLDRLRVRGDGDGDRYNPQQKARAGEQDARYSQAYMRLANEPVANANKE
jgi:hypothetical protein